LPPSSCGEDAFDGYAARRAAEQQSTSSDLPHGGNQLAVHATGGLLVLFVITALSGVQTVGLTRCGQHEQQARRSPQTIGVKAMSSSDNETSGGILSRGFRVSSLQASGRW